MIGYFPDPYPDELFYSMCARFADRMQYPSRRAVISEIFGCENAIAIAELPTRLDNVIATLRPEHYTADDLIDQHTLLPFYGPFMPSEWLNRLRADMRSNSNGVGIYRRAGIAGCHLPWPEWLQYCPLCMGEDKQHFGEPYWHRIHQVPGVQVCPTHHVGLEQSGVRVRNQKNKQEFVSIEQAVQPGVPRSLDLPDFHDQVLLDIANEADWLLSQHKLSIDLAAFHKQCFIALSTRGLASRSGVLHRSALRQALRDHYPHDLLEILKCDFDEQTRMYWIPRLAQNSPRMLHPLYHLLLIHFLGYTLQEFLDLPAEGSPFGEGPWPCLNPACDYYLQPVIQQCHVKTNYNYPGGQPMGIFACTCGFVYTRKGPELSIEDRFRRDRNVKVYGPVWEAKLVELWNEPSLNLKQLARQLGVKTETAERQAVRLGLSFPYRTSITTRSGLKQLTKSKERRRPSSDRLEFHRSKWRAALEQNPGVGPTKLMKECHRSYGWLKRNDAEWLESHMPLPQKRKSWSPHVDWRDRDQRLAEAVRSTAVRLKNHPDHLIRITQTAIGREIGQPLPLLKNADKLPLTAQALSEVTETREAFAVRRIWWVAKGCLREKLFPTRAQLIDLTHIWRELKRGSLPVKQAIDAALQMLSEHESLPGLL